MGQPANSILSFKITEWIDWRISQDLKEFWIYTKYLSGNLGSNCSCPITTIVIFLKAIWSVPIFLNTLHFDINATTSQNSVFSILFFCSCLLQGLIPSPLQSAEFYCCLSKTTDRALSFKLCTYLIQRAGSCYLDWKSLSHPLVGAC